MTEQAQARSVLGDVLDDPHGTISLLLGEVIGRWVGDEQAAQVVAGRLMSVFDRAGDDGAANLVLVERNAVLAAALGACDCWGELPDCPVCASAGRAGWRTPDYAAFDEYVAPALAKRKGTSA